MKKENISYEISYKPKWFSFKPFKVLQKKVGIETVCCWTGISSTDFSYEEIEVVDSYKTVEEAQNAIANRWSLNTK